jgi:hypothetical protein
MISECVHGKIARTTSSPAAGMQRFEVSAALWDNICEAARCPGLLFHDLRRTAARNLRRAGVDVSTLKRIGGWLTDKVLERYSIVAQSDIKDAIVKLETGRNQNLSYALVTIPTSRNPEQLQPASQRARFTNMY